MDVFRKRNGGSPYEIGAIWWYSRTLTESIVSTATIIATTIIATVTSTATTTATTGSAIPRIPGATSTTTANDAWRNKAWLGIWIGPYWWSGFRVLAKLPRWVLLPPFLTPFLWIIPISLCIFFSAYLSRNFSRWINGFPFILYIPSRHLTWSSGIIVEITIKCDWLPSLYKNYY